MHTATHASPTFFPRNGEQPVHVAFLLVPQFAMLAFSAAVEPLRVANRLSGHRLFTWSILSTDGAPVSASNHIQIVADHAIHEVDRTGMLIVCSSFQPERYETKSLLGWLKKQARQGALIGALDTGCHILATAGLLDNYRVTLHWEAIPAFQEEFPHISVSHKIFEIDRERFTCAGGMASLDMLLYFIGQQYGQDLAFRVAEQFIYEHARKSEQQRLGNVFKLGLHNTKLLTVLEIMESNIEHPLECEKMSSLVNISRRQLERLFRTHLKTSPTEYYTMLRLTRGRQLLQQSSLPVTEVAFACGFSSASAFTRAYRSAFGHPPSRDRNIVSPVMAGKPQAETMPETVSAPKRHTVTGAAPSGTQDATRNAAQGATPDSTQGATRDSTRNTIRSTARNSSRKTGHRAARETTPWSGA